MAVSFRGICNGAVDLNLDLDQDQDLDLDQKVQTGTGRRRPKGRRPQPRTGFRDLPGGKDTPIAERSLPSRAAEAHNAAVFQGDQQAPVGGDHAVEDGFGVEFHFAEFLALVG